MIRRGFGLFFLLLLTGCSPRAEVTSTQIFAMDTIMTLTACGVDSDEAVAEASDLIYQLEDLLSVTDETSEIWEINHAQGEWVAVSPHTLAVVEKALQLAQDTQGAIDPTIYPVLTAWGFTTGEYQVPQQTQLEELLPLVDYTAVEVDKERASIRMPAEMELDLGAVAKGYTADCVADCLAEMDYAVLSLGGNAHVIGQKPGEEPWRVGIQDPQGDGYLAVVSPLQGAVVTSGGYQRYFEENGTTYWHILDPSTGSPAQTDLTSVTIIGASGARCDGLSTALFVMGLDGASDYWRSHQDFDLVVVDNQGIIHVTQTIYDRFQLAEGVETAVEVIAP